MNNQPLVKLVGAGPGDPELITIKGLRAIQWADVILYDALIDQQLLAHAREDAQCIYVGKRSGQHSMNQNEINALMLKCAMNFSKVLRLKGGDPFIFGRGREEVDFLKSYGIETEVIPGLSSATALATQAELALTERGKAESFWVVTATTRHKTLSTDLQQAARSSATVVVLMGLAKLPQIAAAFAQENKADIPALLIENGSLPNEQRLAASLSELPGLAQRHNINGPTLLIIGRVTENALSHISLNLSNYTKAPMAAANA